MLVVIVEGRPHRIGERDADFRIPRLEAHADAGKGSARADGGHESVDLAFRLLPDLRSRRLDMGLAVRHVVELVGPQGADGGGEPGRILHIVVRILVGNGGDLDELGAELAERIFLFLALGNGNNDDRAKAEGIGDDGQADAGVAGGALDDGAAKFQLSIGERVANDEEGGPILHRLAGIHEFGLAEDFTAGRVRCRLQANQRGVADGFKNG